MDYTAVDNKNLPLLKALPALRELSIDSADVNDDSVSVLTSMSGLEKLNLYHTLVTEAGVQKIKAALPRCEVIWERDSALPNRRKS
jgi:hypothetical protein